MSLLDRVPSYTLSTATRIAALVAITGLGLVLSNPASAQNPCTVPDNGSGTVTLPPQGCDYLSPDEVHMIIDGLPPGTTIEFAPIHRDFICSDRLGHCTVPIPPGQCEGPGGGGGGNADCSDSQAQFQLQGTGTLQSYQRIVQMPLSMEVHTAPRTPGAQVQDFDAQMMRLEGQLPPGDPDFDLLRITGGQQFGMPSPGHTTLTRVGPPGSNYTVDSFFDVFYRIDFVGRAGGPLAGMSGSTTGTIRMATGQDPCLVGDNGTGTVRLPPEGCDYLSPDEVHMILDGLPPGTTVELDAIHKNFFCGGGPVQGVCSIVPPPAGCEQPGGTLSGNLDCFDSQGELEMTGTGDLAGFHRTVSVPLSTEVHTGPRTPGDPVQSFDTDMFRLFGQINGDPDFDLLRVVGGTDFGLPSPGHTTLTQMGAGAPGSASAFAVDSFFDITYRIDYVGAPGGALAGRSGSTTATIRMIPVPEPGVLAGLLAGVAALVGLRRWRQRE